MKHLLQAAAAAAVLVIASASAFAQAPAPAPAPGAPAAPAAPDAAAPAAMTVETVLAAVNGMEAAAGEVAAVPEGATLTVVPISDYVAQAGGAEITTALTANETLRVALQTAIEGNAALVALLATKNVTPDEVGGIDITGNEVIVFTRQN